MAEIFPRDRLFIIAGPCVVEDDALNIGIANELRKLSSRVPGGIVYKASFDKANRSNRDAARGPGIEQGLAALERVKDASGMAVITDVHLPDQCSDAARVADALQIPAFLCRQTELLAAAARTGKAVNVKKGQFLSGASMKFAAEKINEVNPAAQVILTDRGNSFGYGDLVVDYRNLPEMAAFGVPVVMDCTHSLQQPNQTSGVTGGKPKLIETIAKAAIAVGADGLFIETHFNPSEAKSDGANMLPLDQLEGLLERLVRVREAIL